VAKKKTAFKGDRSDPKANKSLAIRTVLQGMPKAKATEVADAVKSQFGHTVSINMIYMVKAKTNIKSARGQGQPRQAAGSRNGAAPSGAAAWVEAIKYARQLLQATGSVENAVALLKAIES
jgi:hypothetical protein